MDGENLKIVVAAHKPYWMPNDAMYVPVHAGAMLAKERIPGFCRDDEGDGGISALNPHLCELTVLYWAWKNLAQSESKRDAVGLVHYRRHFAGSGDHGVLTQSEAASLLSSAAVILPKQRNYYIETLKSHYEHTFSATHMDLLMEAVATVSPESVPALRQHLSGTKGHMFNMFVMRSDLLCDYCEWLFPIMGYIESSFDYNGMSSFEARSPGRLSEYLLDTWLQTKGISYVECSIRDMEPVNWVKKGSSFLAAKFFGKKYEKSF